MNHAKPLSLKISKLAAFIHKSAQNLSVFDSWHYGLINFLKLDNRNL